MKRTALICLLDKQYPPDHSFITGMLAKALPNDGQVRVYLLAMAPHSEPIGPVRYHGVVCLPMIPDFTRRGGSRVRAMLRARRLGSALVEKTRSRGERTVLFVRNHPALFLVAASLRYKVDGFIFQSSHPLEKQHKSYFLGLAYRAVIGMCGWAVDGVLAVSALGLQRTQRLFKCQTAGLVVPLLSDLPSASTTEEGIWGGGAQSVRFIYSGTHAARRRLEVVLEGIVEALDSGIDAMFVFLGGGPQEINALRQTPGVTRWEGAGGIRFFEPVPRSHIPRVLHGADVGLSLVPETSINREMSPTKLVEYMGARLAVLASFGVEQQEAFVKDSKAGLLVSFDSHSIARGISRMAANPEFLACCKVRAGKFSRKKLNYSNYVGPLKAMLQGKFCDIGKPRN